MNSRILFRNYWNEDVFATNDSNCSNIILLKL